MRLIDADALIKDLSYLYTKNHIPIDMKAEEVLTTIMEQSTIYDVDKVVEELEGAMWLTTNDDGKTNKLSIQVVSFDDAIEIVKAGGKNE